MESNIYAAPRTGSGRQTVPPKRSLATEFSTQFPTIEIDDSLARLVARHDKFGTMRGTLEDSAYLVLPSESRDEDDDYPDSLSGLSLGGQTVDEVSSVAGTDTSVEEEDFLGNQPLELSTQYEHVSPSEAISASQDGRVCSSDEESDMDDDLTSHLTDSFLSQRSEDRESTDFDGMEDSTRAVRAQSPPLEPTMQPSLQQERIPNEGFSDLPRRGGRSTSKRHPTLAHRAGNFLRFVPNGIYKQRLAIAKLTLTLVSVIVALCFRQYYMPEIIITFEGSKLNTTPSHTTALATATTAITSMAPIVRSKELSDVDTGKAVVKLSRPETALTLLASANDFNSKYEFTAEVLEDNRIAIMTSKQFQQLKRVPELKATIKRRSSSASKTDTTLIRGSVAVKEHAYIITIDREQAYGEIQILVEIKKPWIKQEFFIDLGSPLKLSRYSAIVNRKWTTAAEELQAATIQIPEALSELSTILLDLHGEGMKTLDKSRVQAIEALHRLTKAANDYAREMTTQPKHTIENHVRAISGNMRRAQINAKRISILAERRLMRYNRQSDRKVKCLARKAKTMKKKSEKKAKKIKREIRKKMKMVRKLQRAFP